MSCTVFYRGKLKNEYTFNDMSCIVQKHAESFDCRFYVNENSIKIEFINGKNEPLLIALEDGVLDGFCKWNGENEEEYYKILDMFIALKPLFKAYHIEDDLGIWHTYLIQNKPCKIKKRTISSKQEHKLLQRVNDNMKNGYSETEMKLFNLIYTYRGTGPYSENICHFMIQDIIKLSGVTTLNPEEFGLIIKVTKGTSGFNEYLSFLNPDYKLNMIMIIWISYCLSYKNKGIVRELSSDIHGLQSSKLAALFGILSNFLNSHSGIINSKHAEINKFVAHNISNQNLFTLCQIGDGGKTEIELLISILDYLGFRYEYQYDNIVIQ